MTLNPVIYGVNETRQDSEVKQWLMREIDNITEKIYDPLCEEYIVNNIDDYSMKVADTDNHEVSKDNGDDVSEDFHEDVGDGCTDRNYKYRNL